MRGTGALARASMADLKPDRVRAAELAQTGAGRGRARGEQAEREHESTCTLLEHDPDFIMRGLRATKCKQVTQVAGGRRRRRRSLELQRGGSEKVGSTRLHHGLQCKWQRQWQRRREWRQRRYWTGQKGFPPRWLGGQHEEQHGEQQQQQRRRHNLQKKRQGGRPSRGGNGR